jgi:ornithine cyclodeaminase/alanine dehydrogenase-like protein (mu-crystallin family)
MRRVGIVGLGKIAETHTRALASIPDLAVVAGADVRPGAALSFREHAIPVYRSAEELCGRHELDVLIVATPTSTHAERCATRFVSSWIGSGINVLSVLYRFVQLKAERPSRATTWRHRTGTAASTSC